jgi:phosphopantetheinyl transferase
VAAAIACLPAAARKTGIDIEIVAEREEGFEAMVLSDSERRHLDQLPARERRLAVTRLWCVKEAAGKALGTGLGGNPHKFVVEQFDPVTGTVHVHAEAAAQEPRLLVHTFVQDDLLVAVTLGDKPVAASQEI